MMMRTVLKSRYKAASGIHPRFPQPSFRSRPPPFLCPFPISAVLAAYVRRSFFLFQIQVREDPLLTNIYPTAAPAYDLHPFISWQGQAFISQIPLQWVILTKNRFFPQQNIAFKSKRCIIILIFVLPKNCLIKDGIH